MQLLLGLVCTVLVQLSGGIYFQPEVLFFSEQPTSQHLVANSDLYLSCGLQLQSLRYEEGGLPLPIIRWSMNGTTNVSEAFPEATNSQTVNSSQYLTSTLHIPHTSHPHTSTYHCYVIDGTAENVHGWPRPSSACKGRVICRGSGLPCQAFITASNLASVTVIENSTSVQTVQLEKCSSLILQCGSLLVGQGLRPELEWDRDGAPLNSSLNIQILSTGDLSLFHSNNVEVAGTYRCIAVSGSHSVTVTTYTVKGGAFPGPSSIFLQLISSPPSPITEGESVDLTLSSAGECLDQLKCVWMRSNSSLCLTDSRSGFKNGNTNVSVESVPKYGCTERGLRVRSLSPTEDGGEYCCVVEGVGSVGVAAGMGTLCLNIEVWERAPPNISSPYNGTTITVDRDRPAILTFSCTSNPDTLSTSNASLHWHWYWLYNGGDITDLRSSEAEEEGGSGVSGRSFVLNDDGRQLEVSGVNGTDVVGVYQCFVGNDFGYSVVTLRVIPNGVANPPGISVVRDAPWPTESSTDFTYNISWSAPSYPSPPTNIGYLLDVSVNPWIPQTTEQTFFLMTLQKFAYYNIILTVIAADSGEVISEPTCFFDELQSECENYVLFPPRLNKSCSNGMAQIQWSKSLLNDNAPGLYYINTTCHSLNGSVYVTNRVFQTEATKHFETEFPLGTKCQFRGAAIPNTCLGTPDACPFRCVDPVDIKYDVTSCEVEAYVELEYVTYEVEEGSYLEVCLLAKGYNFSFVLVVDYGSNNTVAKELFISIPGEKMCSEVEVEDNSADEEDRTATITLSSTSPQVKTGPSSTVTILDDDDVSVFFSQSVYEVYEGWPVTVCVEASRDIELKRPVALNLSFTNIPAFGGIDYKPMYASHQFMLNMDQISYCVELNTSDDGSVNSNKTFQLILKSSDDAVNISLSLVTVVIMDDDAVHVGFSQTSYTTTVDEEIHMCILASGRLERTLAVDISVNREGLQGGHIVELTHQVIVFSSAHSNVCVLLNTSGITHTVMVVLVLSGSNNERSILWTNQNATVTIFPITTAPSSGPEIVIAVLATLIFIALCVAGGCCLVVEIFRRKKRDKQFVLQPEPLNKDKEVPLGLSYLVPLDDDTATLFESLEYGVLSSVLTAEGQDKELQISTEPETHKQMFPLSTSKNTSSSSGCSDMSSSTHHDYIAEDELKSDHSAIHRQAFVSDRTAAHVEQLVRKEKDEMDLLSDIAPQFPSLFGKLSEQDSGLGMEMKGSGGGGVEVC